MAAGTMADDRSMQQRLEFMLGFLGPKEECLGVVDAAAVSEALKKAVVEFNKPTSKLHARP